MYHYCVRVYLNMFIHMFTLRLCIWNPILFSASVSNADAWAVQVPSGSTHPCWIPHPWILIPLNVNQYHVRRCDALPVRVFCDIPLDFLIRMSNILESVFGSPDCGTIKTHVHGFGAFLNNSSIDYALCCGIFYQ